ncbi:MAG: hypothetical protein ACR2RV_19810 [Verrucomicrobiales bacterium]
MRILDSEASRSALLALAVGVLLSACAGLGGESEPEEEDTQRVDMTEERVFLGNVTLVNEKSRFVLIKTPVNQRLQPGYPLQSFNDRQLSAELGFSPEQIHGFMTADIREGAPAVGDQVYLRHTEDFETDVSPRMQQAMDKREREENMNFFEKWKYKREQKRRAREKRRAMEE